MYVKYGKFAVLSCEGRCEVIVPGTAIEPDAFLDKPGNEESDRTPAYLVLSGVNRRMAYSKTFVRFINESASLPSDEAAAREVAQEWEDCSNRIAVINSFKPNGYYGLEK